MQWARGLTVTTTGLDKHEKDAIRQDVEDAGGRWGPHPPPDLISTCSVCQAPHCREQQNSHAGDTLDAALLFPSCCSSRYSPNLSKRTTHLVTPEVVGSVTQKLAAAAGGGPGQQQRFKELQVVSRGWVSASAGLRARADETQFAPLLPPPGASACSAEVSVHWAQGSSCFALRCETGCHCLHAGLSCIQCPYAVTVTCAAHGALRLPHHCS